MADDCTVVRFSKEPSLVRIESLKNIDSPDRLSENGNNFGIFYVFFIVLSIITYIIDLSLAITLLYYYYIGGYGLYFALTLTFILVPSILMTTISLRWYIIDHDDPSLGRISIAQWVIRMIFLLLQLAPLLRYVDTLIYGIRSKIAASTDNDSQQVTLLYRRMLDEDSNGALLRLFHCFLHAAPQAVIQLVILLIHVTQPGKNDLGIDVLVIQSWAVLAGVVSSAWSLTAYHCSVRYSRDDKDKIKGVGILVAFCWQLMSSLSRVLALGLLASVFPAWMGCACALHWVVMAVWLALGQQQPFFLSIILGLAYILAFVNPREGPTRYSYLAYYLVCFMENTGALVVWCNTKYSSDHPALYYGAAGSQVVAFGLAIVFLLIYYKFCHPSIQNRVKIPRDESELETDRPCYSKATSYNIRSKS